MDVDGGWSWTTAAIGAGIGAGVGASYALLNDKKGWGWYALGGAVAGGVLGGVAFDRTPQLGSGGSQTGAWVGIVGYENTLNSTGQLLAANGPGFLRFLEGLQPKKLINLQSSTAGEQLVEALRKVHAKYKKQGFSGNIFDTDIVDRNTAPLDKKMFNMNKITVRLHHNISKSLEVTYTYTPGNQKYRLGRGATTSQHFNETYSGSGIYTGHGDVVIRLKWGVFNFNYRLKEGKVNKTAFKRGKSLLKEILRYIKGESYSLPRE